MSPHIISLLLTFHEIRRAHATGSALLHALRTGVKAGAHLRFDRPFNGAGGLLTSLVVKALLLLAVSSTVTIALGAGVFAAQMDDDHGNTLQTATDLPLDTSVQGRLETSDDIDFFKIDLSREAGPTRLRIFTDGELYTSGRLYYEDGSEFGYGDYFYYGRGYNFHISATLQSGTYYVSVEAYYGQTGDYEIRAEKPPPDDHSDEIEGSTAVALNSSTSGRIEPFDDQDVFKLDLSGASSATEVRIYTSGDLDTIGELYDDDEELIAYSDDSGGRRRFNFSIRAAMTPGVYYVFVRGFYFDIGDYTLHIDTVPSDDHGQTFATATNVTMESSTQGSIDAQDDNDFFVLDLTANTRPIDVWIYTTGDVDTVGYLYDSNEELIAAVDDLAYNVFKGSEFNFHILENLFAEVYYINVRGYRPQSGKYTLHIKGVPPDDHGNDADNPSTLALGSSVTGTVDTPVDLDVFTLDLSSASDMTDLWVYTTGDLDTIAAIYDADGGFETYGDDISPDDERNTHLRAILSPGVYNIWLTGYGTETGDYTLVAEVAPTAGTSLSSARTLTLGEAVPGTIDLSGDPNYHRLNVSQRKDLTLVIGSADGESIDVEVLDSEGNEIEVNVYPIYGVSFFFLYILGMSIEDDFKPGSYYLKVTAPALTNDDLGRRQSIQAGKSRPLLETVPGYKDATPKHFIIYDPQPVQYTILPSEDKAYTAFIEDCRRETRALNVPSIKDALYGCQWHLNNPGGQDVNVESAWSQGFMGEGVNVAIVGNGMDSSQIDLKDNVDVDSNHDYTGQGDIYDRFAHHGTHTAGIIAARDNDVGVRGVAPRATIYGYNLLAYLTITNLLDATTRGRNKTAVSNNSWGLVSGAWPVATDAFWEAAVESGLSEGNYGKGTFYVFSAGNGHRSGSSSNLNEFTNFYGVTAVCAVNDQDVRSQYSETGANLWVCAPSNDIDDDHRGILTTENSDRYHEDFGGTSAAAPIVAGTAALMRSANPDLTWRDLKLILAGTARKNDAGNSGWEDGAYKYGSDSERYHFNNEYGFGVVDAGAAVDLAKTWINVSPLEDSAVEASDLGMTIPDAPGTGTPTSVTSSLSVDTDIGFTEYVEVTVGVEHTYFRDLDIELVSPSGAVSKLVDHIDTYAVPVYGKLRLGSARFLGEDPNGVWQLRITDQIPEIEGSLDSWALKIYGHQRIPGPPIVDWATAGTGSLTVGWTSPHQTAGLPVASYDIRYIPSDSSDKSDPNWVTLEGVWTKAVGGNLEHTIPALGDNVRYDVQVRAVNSSTTGA